MLAIEAIKYTPNIVGYTRKEWLKCEHIIIAEDERGQMLGACLNYDFAEKWTKIAALYVFDEFRGRGIGRSLFYKSFDDATNRHKNVYTISRNPTVIKMMNELNFTTFDSFLNFPDRFQPDLLDFYIHSLQWLASPYRIQEIVRKQIAFPSQQDFIYGLKSNVKYC
ncbi:GNAT family N-acetyltransferase [Chamaesiphon polymorphus]|nr:GNAT family N-acetyltransferase [Chamaesiphon polymorphus]